ncbi:MAG: site-specific integrase, partial [Planctomycetota bacterium]
MATWRGRNGKERTALVVVAEDGSNRIKVETKVFYAKYCDGLGQVQVVATGCRDKEVAERKLKQLESVAE